MEAIKQFLKALLFPKTVVIAVCVPIAAALLLYTFGFCEEKGIVAYVSYAFSTYSLVILCAGLGLAAKRAREAKDRVIEIASQNPYVNRYMTDVSFKAKITLLFSLVLNAGYAVLKFVAGIFYGSAWLITLTTYYALLMVIRLLLFRHLDKNAGDRKAEWKRYRACGIVLAFMNIILIGIVVLVLQCGEGFEYPGYLIYAMALYDFYTMTMAVISLIKSRKQNSPVLTAAKVINAAAALIAMLSLETAMLTQFDRGSDPAFRHNMIAYTGGGICIIMVVMSVFMIIKATQSLKRMRFNNSQTQ